VSAGRSESMVHMAKNEANKTLADYVAGVLSPMLIMALVGSLVFFLIKVLYVGEFEGRMQWILFFFVFGAVLIGRISMQGDIAGRAGLYGLVLGALVFIGLLLYVEYPADSPLASYGWAVNLGLIALISTATMPMRPAPVCCKRPVWRRWRGSRLLRAIALLPIKPAPATTRQRMTRNPPCGSATLITANRRKRPAPLAFGWFTSRWPPCRSSDWGRR
jgi:hypothetical protein